MSTTAKLPDECKRLLDNGWMIVLVRSVLGDYTAMAVAPRSEDEMRVIGAFKRALKTIPDSQLTGDFEPSQALAALTDKVFGCAGGSGDDGRFTV